MKLSLLSFILLLILQGYSPVFSQISPELPGSSWQQTFRITGLIEPYDFYSEFNYDEDAEIEYTNEFRKRSTRFWHSLRDSINSAIFDGRINAYTIKPSDRAGQERIFVKDQQIGYQQLITNLNRSLEQVANLRMGDVVYLLDRDDVVDLRNYVSDFDNYFQNLGVINQFEIEFRMTYNESGFYIRPTQLILGVAMYPSRFQFEENRLSFFNEYGNGTGFLIDLADPAVVRFLSNSGVQASGETNIISFYDLFMAFNYEYVFYSISGRELAQSSDGPFDYELERIRRGVMNQVHTLLFEQIYGQIPGYWEASGKGLIINGLD
jgi:hypothetical protein